MPYLLCYVLIWGFFLFRFWIISHESDNYNNHWNYFVFGDGFIYVHITHKKAKDMSSTFWGHNPRLWMKMKYCSILELNSNNGTRSLRSDTYSEFASLANVKGRKKGIGWKFCWYTKLPNQADCLYFKTQIRRYRTVSLEFLDLWSIFFNPSRKQLNRQRHTSTSFLHWTYGCLGKPSTAHKSNMI